jgi:four helix bundle protein
LEQRKQVRWAEQLRAAALSITNNIAEGSGSFSKAEFAQFLNFSRRSAFETANILMLLAREQTLPDTPNPLLAELDEICRMITAFRKTLL